MPMMIVNDEDFEIERQKLEGNKVEPKPEQTENTIVTSLDLFKQQKGRPAGRLEIPSSLRALVAEEAICGGDTKQIVESFGVSKSSIAAYKKDATSTASYNKPDAELKKANDEVRDEISTKARSRLISALDKITDEKLGEAKVRDIASIAQAMSGIVKNMEPTVVNQNVTNNQVVVYRPRQSELDEFEVITVNE